MGHAVEYYEYPVSVSKEKIQAELNRIARAEGDCHINLPTIHWYSVICETEEEAEQYIEERDKAFYGQYAVRYYKANKLSPTKQLEELKGKYSVLKLKYQKAISEIHCKNFKSQYISCKKCGSKLAVQYMCTNVCPLCRTDIRPQSVIDNIAKMSKQLTIYENKIKQIDRERQMKQKNREVMWKVKIEYHV